MEKYSLLGNNGLEHKASRKLDRLQREIGCSQEFAQVILSGIFQNVEIFENKLNFIKILQLLTLKIKK